MAVKHTSNNTATAITVKPAQQSVIQLNFNQAAGQVVNSLRFVVLDLELTGLNCDQDEIVALGWVNIEHGLIDYSSAHYVLNQHCCELKQSPVLHGVTADELAVHGKPLDQTLELLAKHIEQTVVVAHHHRLDWAFLCRAAAKYRIHLAPLALVDTLSLAQRQLVRQGQSVPKYDALTLTACRTRLGLANSQQHHALADAIACAELFQAQLAHFGSPDTIHLKQLQPVKP